MLMTGVQPTPQQAAAVQRYFVQEFPSYSQQTWWDEGMQAQVFEFDNGAMLRRGVIDSEVFGGDCAAVLRRHNLADAMRAVRTPTRGFYVVWQDRTLSVRSQALW